MSLGSLAREWRAFGPELGLEPLDAGLDPSATATASATATTTDPKAPDGPRYPHLPAGCTGSKRTGSGSL